MIILLVLLFCCDHFVFTVISHTNTELCKEFLIGPEASNYLIFVISCSRY